MPGRCLEARWFCGVVSLQDVRRATEGADVLGDSSCPRTVKKPPNWISSGSGLGSWFKTPISMVPSFSAR